MTGACLGVDYGTVRIGLAISEAPDLPAMPLDTIEHTNRERDVARLLEIARARNVTRIVIGNPVRLDGTSGPAATKAEKFASAVRERFDGEVIQVDERLTTAAAHAKLREGELALPRRRALVDRLAAVEILQTYLSRARRTD